MQTGVKSRQQGKKFVSLYIFQLIHKSGLLNVALMWTKQAERASRLQKQYHSFIWGLGGVTKVHNVILVSKPREGSVGNQILFAYFFILADFGINSIYKHSKVMAHTDTLFGINSRKCLILKSRDYTFSVFV